MDISEKNFKKLERLFNLMDDNALTKEEFVKSFENVVKLVKQIEAKMEKAITDLETTYKNATTKNKTDHEINLTNIRKMFAVEMKKLEDLKADLLDKVSNKLAEVKDGLDADEEIIVDKVLGKIKLPEQKEVILDDAFEIRNKLETLNGEERLSVEAINGLKEFLEEIKSRPVGGKGGGGFSKMAMDIHFIDTETPAETPNGVITDFKLLHTPNPTASLKVYKDGQRMKLGAAADYTLSGKTVTFVTAPLTDSIITFEYRI